MNLQIELEAISNKKEKNNRLKVYQSNDIKRKLYYTFSLERGKVSKFPILALFSDIMKMKFPILRKICDTTILNLSIPINFSFSYRFYNALIFPR